MPEIEPVTETDREDFGAAAGRSNTEWCRRRHSGDVNIFARIDLDSICHLHTGHNYKQQPMLVDSVEIMEHPER
jgi:hypothetical protein